MCSLPVLSNKHYNCDNNNMGLLALVNLAVNVFLCLSYTALSSFLPPERPKQNDTIHLILFFLFFFFICTERTGEGETKKSCKYECAHCKIV